MPGSLKTEAIVLRSIRYGEADRILHLYTPNHGRLVQAMRLALNSHPSQYMTIHREKRIIQRLGRNSHVYARLYTIDVFPKYTYIHHETSPSITVL